MNPNNASSSNRRRWAWRYGLAFVAVAAGFGLRAAVTAWIGPGLPTYITFYPAVMVAALLAGLGPGLLATALTALSVAYWILPPEGLAIASPVERLGVVLFTGMGLFMSAVAELYRRDRRKAAAYDHEIALRITRREKDFLADVLERTSQPFAVGYPDGRLGLCNRAFEQLTGYSAEELRVIDWATMLTPPEWRELERQKLEELQRTGQPARYEKEYVRKDGTRVPIESLVHLVKDAGGKPEYYYSFLTDITGRKRAEDALRQSEERYRTMFDTMLEGFCIIEVLFDADDRPIDYRFLEINSAFEAQTGLRNARGKRMRELAPEHEAHWFEIYGKVALTGEPARFTNEAKALNRWYDVSAYRVGGPDSRKVAILFNNITQRIATEETLRQITQELERSNRDLEQFAYVASHDLQEPLRAVGGYVKLLQHRFPEKVDAAARDYITGAAAGAQRMQRLITDLLAYSRVGTQSKAFVPADLNALLNDALNNVQASIKEAGAKVTSDPLPTLTVDATQIVQLFQNLIANAIKFHSDRTPVIHVGARREKDQWLFWVRDNGIGIDPRYSERIFQIFQRLHTRRQYPGTGIGLAICKKIVERHGGEIRVESQPAQGATFYFSIPEISAKKEPVL